jgi:glutathione synthase
VSGPLDVLFVIDPPRTFNPRADSTYVMVTEALRRGHRAYGVELPGLSLHEHRAFGRVAPLRPEEDGGAMAWDGASERRPLDSFHVVVMRKDPPVDEGYIASTWLLDLAGTHVVNAPRGLRELNEKLAIARFADLAPRTYISRDPVELREILGELGGRMIVKPIYGFGGREVLLVSSNDQNTGTLLELATAEGSRWTVAQEYLPAAKEGDKRILLVDGDPIGAVLRVPARGEIRNNFHAGGSPALTDLDDVDRAICSRVAPLLRELGQFFVGLDVIGGKLTEVNVTSPTGMQEINRLCGLSADTTPSETMQARFWDALEKRIGSDLGARRGS